MVWGIVTSGPNEAFSVKISSRSTIGFLIKPGERRWVWPCVHKVLRIPIEDMILQIESPRVNDSQGVLLTVNGTAKVMVTKDYEEGLHNAFKNFHDKTQEQIHTIALEKFESHQQAIVGKMSLEDINKDRDEFNKIVMQAAAEDLIGMGISVFSYTVKDVR